MMMSGMKKLSIAFYWHMHQPIYQLNIQSDYLMPWVRLHAVKDYLSMFLFLDDFKKLKVNFNLVPVLLDALIEYGEKGYHDIHSRLTVTDVSDLTPDDKEFILNNFFDANYKTMIYHHERYNELYQKRFEKEIVNIDDFSDQEYSDIMALFNIAWTNPIFKKIFPKINELTKKERNYTFEDRINLIEIHREIIKRIIPKIKELLKKGQIEITTSPYFHPILPILLDDVKLKKNNFPEKMDMKADAYIQTKTAIDRIEELFGVKPKGMWPSEQCVSENTLKVFSELGINWTVADEGILSESLNKNFIRDFQGYLEDPYFLMKSYKFKTAENNDIKIVFRDSVIPNLISFEYSNHDPKVAANDLYERIKIIQNKLQSSPDKHHLLTIAMDGENCWENYLEDYNFIKTLYKLIEEDKTLETVLISEYLDRKQIHTTLNKLHAGSWINKDFKLWINEPTKDLAWKYLKSVRNDLMEFTKKYPNNENNDLAYRELLIAEGSDWFWWYGEPNDSGQDNIFDYLFRERLKNIYFYLSEKAPKYLDTTLLPSNAKPSRYPKTLISPIINGKEEYDNEWLNAGCIAIPDGPILKSDKLFDRICFGFDNETFYLRFYLKQFQQENLEKNRIFQQIYVYLRNGSRKQLVSPSRLINQTDNIYPMMKEKFHNEMRLSVQDGFLHPVQIITAMDSGLWKIENSKELNVAYKDTIDLGIPFDLIDIEAGECVEFFFATAQTGIKETLIPQDVLLSIQRPL